MIEGKQQGRKQGNMLLLTCLIGGLVLIVLLIGITVALLFHSQSRLQAQADRLALAMAERLNRNDRLGQMNNMLELSRELVFASRKDEESAHERTPHIEPLAKQLLEEAREGARLVNEERTSLAQLTNNELKEMVRQSTEILESSAQLRLPWIRTSAPVIDRLETGRIVAVESNAQAPQGLPELKEMDLVRRYIRSDTQFYRAGVNAKLVSADSDLDYKFSSLPAPVKGTVSPARLTSGAVFRRTNTLVDSTAWLGGNNIEQLPSALKLELTGMVATDLTAGNFQSRRVTAVGAASGAMPLP
ncbi:MAG TPA: hypothetical protein V6D17_20740 [Candidatus Obscuribacterales bacterium]